MTAVRSSLQNRFATTLTAEMGPNDLTAVVTSIGSLTSPTYVAIEPESDVQAEYIYFDGTFTGTSFVTTNIANRYLPGSAAGSNLTHPIGSKVWVVPLAQHIEDLHDRIEALLHAGFSDLGNDHHTQYSLVSGARAFTGEVGGVTPTVGASLATKSYVDTADAGVIPPGVISAYAGASAPTGYLMADGAEISRATYADLFAAIGTTFGVGDGATTFDLPDLRGRFPLGLAAAGTGSTLGEIGGTLDPTIDLIHSHTVDAHTHDIAHGHADTIAYASGGAHTHSIDHNHASVTSGAGTAHTHTTPNHTHDISDTSNGPSSTSGPFSSAGATLVASSTHTHFVSDTSTSENGGNTGAESTHTHSVDLPNFVGTSGSDGAHTHTKSGGVTSLGTTASGAASASGTDTVGSATAAVPNAPFLAVNYIIKT